MGTRRWCWIRLRLLVWLHDIIVSSVCDEMRVLPSVSDESPVVPGDDGGTGELGVSDQPLRASEPSACAPPWSWQERRAAPPRGRCEESRPGASTPKDSDTATLSVELVSLLCRESEGSGMAAYGGGA